MIIFSKSSEMVCWGQRKSSTEFFSKFPFVYNLDLRQRRGQAVNSRDFGRRSVVLGGQDGPHNLEHCQLGIRNLNHRVPRKRPSPSLGISIFRSRPYQETGGGGDFGVPLYVWKLVLRGSIFRNSFNLISWLTNWGIPITTYIRLLWLTYKIIYVRILKIKLKSCWQLR